MLRLTILFLYFFVTVMFLGAIGVWLPLAIDYFPKEALSTEGKHSLPQNLLTYFLSIFFISVGDRVFKIIDNNEYSYKKLELLLSVIFSIVCVVITYYAYMRVYQGKYGQATLCCIFGTLLAYLAWAYSYWNDEKMNPNNATPTPKI